MRNEQWLQNDDQSDGFMVVVSLLVKSVTSHMKNQVVVEGMETKKLRISSGALVRSNVRNIADSDSVSELYCVF